MCSDDTLLDEVAAGEDVGAVRCQSIKIPLVSTAESLNAAVACAIILGEAQRQRAKAITVDVDIDSVVVM